MFDDDRWWDRSRDFLEQAEIEIVAIPVEEVSTD